MTRAVIRLARFTQFQGLVCWLIRLAPGNSGTRLPRLKQPVAASIPMSAYGQAHSALSVEAHGVFHVGWSTGC